MEKGDAAEEKMEEELDSTFRHTLQVYKTLVLLKAGLSRRSRLPSPQGRPGYPLTSKAKAKHEGRPRRCFSPGPAMRVLSPESTTPQHSDFLHFTVSFFSSFWSLFPFSLSISSLSLQSPQKGLIYTLAATHSCLWALKSCIRRFFSPFLAFSCLLFLGC